MMPDNRDLVNKLTSTFTTAKNKHALWESEWENAARYMLPKSGGFYDANVVNVPKDTSDIYDPTPRVSVRKASAALYAYSANPSTEWFGIAIPAKKNTVTAYNDILRNTEVKSFIEETTHVVRRHLNAALISTLRYAYDELIVFGTSGIFLMEENNTDVSSSYSLRLKDLYPLSDGNGKINCIFRRLELTPQQASNLFGFDNLSQPTKDTLRTGQGLEKESTYLHCVYKRDEYNIDPDAQDAANMPWASIYLDRTNSHIIKESGYQEQPFGIGRLSPIGSEVYCNSPGIDALPAVTSLNKLCYQQLDIGDNALAPSYNVPEGVYKKQINLNPYALNYYNKERAAGLGLISSINQHSGYSIGKDLIEDKREQVRASLYDLMVEESSGRVNYGIQQEHIRQLILMSPWNYSLEKDLYKPLVNREYQILKRKGMLPATPAVLLDYLGADNLDIVFDNPLSRASQFPQIQAIDRVLQVAGNLAPMGGMYMIDIFKTIEIYRKFTGAPMEMVRSVTAAQGLQQKDQQAAAQQQQQQGQLQGAESLSKTYKNVNEVGI